MEKKPYELPKVLKLDDEMARAEGSCTGPGSGDAECGPGNTATNECTGNGTSATGECEGAGTAHV
jgi:hypothetical protein